MRGDTGFIHINRANGPDDSDERLELDGHVLHIAKRDGFHEVWLNTEVADFDGIYIGEGQARSEAVADAVKTLERAVELMQLPRLTSEESALVISAIPLQALPVQPKAETEPEQK